MVNNNTVQNQNNHAAPQIPRSAVAALLLAAFLGLLGIHRFYLGRAISGIIMLLLTLTFFLSIISTIWAFIDLIRILMSNLKDVNNNDLLIENKTTFVTIAVILLILMFFPLLFLIMFVWSFIALY